jgi:hypothetical protein
LRHHRHHLSLLRLFPDLHLSLITFHISPSSLCAFAALREIFFVLIRVHSRFLFVSIRGFFFASFAPFRGYSSFPLPLCVFVALCEIVFASIRGPLSRSSRSFDAVNAYLATIVKLGQQDPSVMDDD